MPPRRPLQRVAAQSTPCDQQNRRRATFKAATAGRGALRKTIAPKSRYPSAATAIAPPIQAPDASQKPARFPPSKRPQSHFRSLLQKASPVQFCNTHKRTGEPGTPLQVLPRPACCGVRSVFQRRVNGRGQRVANSCLLTGYGPHRMPLVAGPCKALLCFGPVQSRSGTTDSRMLGWLWQPF